MRRWYGEAVGLVALLGAACSVPEATGVAPDAAAGSDGAVSSDGAAGSSTGGSDTCVFGQSTFGGCKFAL